MSQYSLYIPYCHKNLVDFWSVIEYLSKNHWHTYNMYKVANLYPADDTWVLLQGLISRTNGRLVLQFWIIVVVTFSMQCLTTVFRSPGLEIGHSTTAGHHLYHLLGNNEMMFSKMQSNFFLRWRFYKHNLTNEQNLKIARNNKKYF